MATKAIKFKDSSNVVYLPVTNSKLVQYGENQSVKQAIDDIVRVDEALLNGINNTGGTLVVSNSATSTSNTATVSTDPFINLISYDGDTVLSSLALEGSGLTVSYADNKLTFTTAAAHNGNLLVSDETNSLVIFSADEETNKTFKVVGGTQITSAVATVENVPTVTISHAEITTTVGNRPTISGELDEHHFDLSYVKEIDTATNGHVSSYEFGIIRFGEGAKAVHGSIVEGNIGYVTGGDVYTTVHTAIEDVAKALKYQGIINKAEFPSNPSKGDTYFFGSSQNINGTQYELGDMAIFDGENWGVVNANWTAVDGNSQLTVGGSSVTLATIGGINIDAQINGLDITDKNTTTTPVAGTISADRKFTAITAVEEKQGGFTYVNTEYTLPADNNSAAIWTNEERNAALLKVGIERGDANASSVKIAGSGSITVSTDTLSDTVTLFAPVVTHSEELKYDTFTLENLEDFSLPLTADVADNPIVTAVSVSTNS